MRNSSISYNRKTGRAAVRKAAQLLVEQLEQRTLYAAQWDRPDFGGNPYVNVTAIDATDDVTLSRTSGQLPFFVQASASAISATGTSRPYEDLEYSWNFGDAGGTETLTNPATGQTVNANSGQTGPEAAYVYRNAGTYTVTLTVRGKNGGSFVTQTFTESVTASAYTGTHRYYDPVGGNDANPGTEASPKQTLPLTIPPDEWAHIKRGTTVNRTIDLEMSNHTRISAYGSGADPIIQQAGSGQVALLVDNGSSKSDIVVSDVALRSTTATGTPTAVAVDITDSPTNTLSHLYFDNVKISSQASAGNQVVDYKGVNLAQVTKSGFWNADVNNTGAAKTGIYGIADEWGFVVGGNISGPGSNEVLDHHIYPQVRRHSLFRWIEFGTGVNRNYAINTNANSHDGSFFQARYHLIADNFITGTNRAIDASDGGLDATKVRFVDFVVQGNAITGLKDADAGDRRGKILWYNLERGTVRDNVAWDNDGTLMALSDTDSSPDNFDVPEFSQPQVYQNLAYTNGTTAFQVDGLELPYVLRDNVVHDVSTAAQLAIADLSTKPAGTVVNGNQWYAPNDGNNQFLFNADASATVSFATWQAGGFDANGSVADPGWLDPATGNFLTATLPTQPDNFVVEAVSHRQINLQWAEGDDEDGFDVEWRVVGTSTWSPLPGSPLGEDESVVSHKDLAPNTAYEYRVRSFNSSGASAWTGPVSATTMDGVTVESTIATYVRDGTANANTNFGTSGELQLKKLASGTGSNREIWLKFDLNTVASVQSAKIRLWGRIDSSTETQDMEVYACSDTSWTETGLTWNNRPTGSVITPMLDVQTIATSTQKWYEWDVTSWIATEKAAGRDTVTLVFKTSSVTTPHSIFSSDDAASNKPQLTVTEGDPLPAWVDPASVATSWIDYTNSLIVGGAATIVADPVADTPVITADGAASVVTIDPVSDTQVHLGGLRLSNGATAVVTDETAGRVLIVASGGGLFIDNTSQLDLTDNDMVAQYENTLEDVKDLIVRGFNGGDWLGSGITSSTAAADVNQVTALGYLDNADFGYGTFSGVTVGAEDILVKFTYYGDADLNGYVDSADYDQFLYGLNNPVSDIWQNGDFDYTGNVDLDDFNMYVYGLNNQGSPL